MPKFEIVYFTGCPLMDRARRALRDARITSFGEINQDKLPPGDENKRLSSPSILADGRLVAGTRGGNGACSILDWDRLPGQLRAVAKL